MDADAFHSLIAVFVVDFWIGSKVFATINELILWSSTGIKRWTRLHFGEPQIPSYYFIGLVSGDFFLPIDFFDGNARATNECTRIIFKNNIPYAV